MQMLLDTLESTSPSPSFFVVREFGSCAHGLLQAVPERWLRLFGQNFGFDKW